MYIFLLQFICFVVQCFSVFVCNYIRFCSEWVCFNGDCVCANSYLTIGPIPPFRMRCVRETTHLFRIPSEPTEPFFPFNLLFISTIWSNLLFLFYPFSRDCTHRNSTNAILINDRLSKLMKIIKIYKYIHAIKKNLYIQNQSTNKNNSTHSYPFCFHLLHDFV